MLLDKFNSVNISNVSYLEDVYAQFLNDPQSVDPSWHYFFRGFELCKQLGGATEGEGDNSAFVLRISRLIRAYRRRGHLIAKTNPLDPNKEKSHPQLEIEWFGFTKDDLDREFPTDHLMTKRTAPLRQILDVLKETYCSTVAVEYMDAIDAEVEKWFQKRMEPTLNRPELDINDKFHIFGCLNQAELFEKFLHTKYVGQKRFSLEGSETLIPALVDVIETGSTLDVNEVVIGMPHRGRLNVLANVLNKSYKDIFSEFEDFKVDNQEISGDVKYHKGYTSKIETRNGREVIVSLASNPSHLEAVDPVLLGKAKAKQILKGDDEQKKILPVLIHGDASFAGQGVVYECFQMAELDGYSVGGTLHIVVNNQIGFTARPEESRSSTYCTDIAKIIDAPVFHVNGDDPEGVIHAVRVGLEFLQTFKKDVVIDIISYRRHGHNEGDEPAFTSPLEYKLIRNKESVRDMYYKTLVAGSDKEKTMADELEKSFKQSLSKALDETREQEAQPLMSVFDGVWSKYRPAKGDELFVPIETGTPKGMLQEIAEKITEVPKDFKVLKQLKTLITKRTKMLEKDAIDWGMAEHLAFGSLLWDGVHVRLSGQDSVRGTFSHRHAAWYDQETGEHYMPLKSLKEGQARFDVYNSLLSEYAALGFEYGYSLSYPSGLIMWEAQFGDFANGAQIMIDQFYCTSEQKWSRYSGLVLLLPHGQEGQGPEHSSARVERFLNNCSQDNIQVAVPTTPAQYFHLLRRQVMRSWRRPLVVLTPKGFLRHPKAVSATTEFTDGRFHEVLDDAAAPKKVKRVMVCSGKVYYDLMKERDDRKNTNVAIVRLEQVYPFHAQMLTDILKGHKPTEVMWVQEEPINQGAYNFIRDRIQSVLNTKQKLMVAARSEAASPAVGSKKLYEIEFRKLMDSAFRELD